MRTRFAEEEVFSREDLLPQVNEGLPVDELFSSSQAEQALQDMQERNEVYYSDGMIYRI